MGDPPTPPFLQLLLLLLLPLLVALAWGEGASSSRPTSPYDKFFEDPKGIPSSEYNVGIQDDMSWMDAKGCVPKQQPDIHPESIFLRNVYMSFVNVRPKSPAHKKILLCTIPRTGCSRWRRLMQVIEGRQPLRPNDPNQNGLDYLSNHPVKVAMRMLRECDRFKFSIVRNPHIRLLSAWLSKVHPNTLNWKRIYGSFSCFVKTIVKEADMEMNTHYRPQSAYCGIAEGVQFDFIGHLETIKQWGNKLFEHLNVLNVTSRGWKSPTGCTFDCKAFRKANRSLTRRGEKTSWDPKAKGDFLKDYKSIGSEVTYAKSHFFFHFTVEAFDMVTKRFQDDIRFGGYQKAVDEMRKVVVAANKGGWVKNVPPGGKGAWCNGFPDAQPGRYATLAWEPEWAKRKKRREQREDWKGGHGEGRGPRLGARRGGSQEN